MMRSILAAGILALIASAVGATEAAVQQEVNESASVSANADIEIYNYSGSIRVTGWDRDEVQVTGTLGRGTERLHFDAERDNVEIRVVVPRGRRGDARREIDSSHLEVMVPRRASVDVEALASSIAIVDVSGPVSMESVAGSVSFTGDARQIDAESIAGDIDVTTTSDRAEIDVTSASGTVLIDLGGGAVSAETLTGNLRVIAGRVTNGDFESVSGSIYFEGALDTAGEVDFENFNGDIELLIPDDTSATFEIGTFSGSIETEFGYEGRRTGRYTPEQELEFTLGGGGATVNIETFAGSVRIRRR